MDLLAVNSNSDFYRIIQNIKVNMNKSSYMPLYSVQMLRAIESRAEIEGVDLMGRAALATADWIAARYLVGRTIWVAAGVGNNGGDALFAAKLLQERGFRVTTIVMNPPKSDATIRALKECEQLGVPCISDFSTLTHQTEIPDLIVDGLLGIGVKPTLNPDLCELIDYLNNLGAPILALDIPSGLDAQTGCALFGSVIYATDTLTFLGQKAGLWMADGADVAGSVHLADLSCHSEEPVTSSGFLNLDHRAVFRQLARPRNSHKGRFGSVAVVGGHQSMLGAALLAGRAALAAGAGKVWLNVLDERLAVDVMAPELMIRTAHTDLGAASALAIGPGLGQDAAAQAAFDFALYFAKPMVIDADALNLMSADFGFAKKVVELSGLTVLTPHPTEAARLLACSTTEVQANRVDAALNLARRFGAVVVLKGAGTVIANPSGEYRVNTTGGNALAVAGQGDVLSGLIAALLALGISPFEAACFGVYVHGLVGDGYETEMGGGIGLSASAACLRISAVLNHQLSHTSLNVM